MRKLIKNISLFIIYASGIYILLLFVWGQNSPNVKYQLGSYGHTLTKMREADTTKNIDILIVGSSHAYRGFDTEMFSNYSLKALNLGTSNQTHIQTKQILHQFINQLKPKLVIYEVFPIVLYKDGVESSLDLVTNGKLDVNTMMMTLKTNHVKTYNTFLYSLLNYPQKNKYQEPHVSGIDTYVKGGYVRQEIITNPPNFKASIKGDKNIKDYQLNALKSNIQYLKRKNIDVLLVQSPVTSKYNKTFTDETYFDGLYKSLCNYINYNQVNINLSDINDFYDAHHLNQNGVNKFNAKLIEDINQRYAFH